MAGLTISNRFARGVRPVIFSLLAVLAVLITPLLTALPVSADWGPDIQLTNAPANSEIPSIAVSGNNVHVAWQDMRDGNYEIYYKHSADGGITWSADIRLTNDAGNSKSPSVAVSGNIIHIVWFDSRDGDEEIYYKRSTDGGITWSADTRLTDCAGISQNPSVAVVGNVVHVVWFDERDGNAEIYYNRSADGGVTWGGDTRLTNATGNSYTPCIAVSGSNVHVAWHDSRDGNEEIYYKRSADGGTNWGADVRLTNAAGNSALASIAVSGNNIHIAWQDQRDGNWEIYYCHSTDGGTTWGANTRLTNAAGNSRYPSIAVYDNNVHLVWADERDAHKRIWYKGSTDGGTTWSSDTRIVNTPELSDYPSIAVSGNNIHVAWQDNSGTYYPRWDIYYKKYTAAPVINAVNPKQVMQGETHSFIINGANFTGATGVSFGDGITINSYNVASDSKITVNITVSLVAAAGPRTISVITYHGTATHGFFVDSNPAIATPHGSSMSGLTATVPQGPVSLPTVSVKSASLSAIKAAPGAPIIVTADVVNTGTVNGAASIKVYVNGELENSQGITVNSGSSTPVTFTVSRSEPGTYNVYVGGASAGSFTVDQFADPNMILYISGALLVFAFIVGVLFILKRRQTQ